MQTNNFEAVPLKNLDEWEEDLLRRYPDPESIAAAKKQMNTGITTTRNVIR